MQPPIYGAYLYDAVYQYAIALNKTLAKKEPTTGENIAEKMHDIQYDSELISFFSAGLFQALTCRGTSQRNSAAEEKSINKEKNKETNKCLQTSKQANKRTNERKTQKIKKKKKAKR